MERLGSLKSERAVSLIAIHAHGIPHVFPPAALKEAEAAHAGDLAGREDWRKLPLVTIDPADAKDHDDAVHAEPDADPKNRGGYVVTRRHRRRRRTTCGPAPRSTARRCIRGNSVYFPDRVVPMLPERISNDLCSLRPNEDRAALAVRMVIGADGRKRAHTLPPRADALRRQAALRSRRRPRSTAGPTTRPDRCSARSLEPLYAAYRALKRARDERAPLDLDLPERKIVLTAHNTVDRVMTPERLDAHRLIEEFMILANVAAAETLERAKRAADLPRARRARHGAGQCAARIPRRRSTSRCPRPARCAPSSSTTSWRA